MRVEGTTELRVGQEVQGTCEGLVHKGDLALAHDKQGIVMLHKIYNNGCVFSQDFHKIFNNDVCFHSLVS